MGDHRLMGNHRLMGGHHRGRLRLTDLHHDNVHQGFLYLEPHLEADHGLEARETT